jgi:dienelactone hydrolase
MVRSNVRSGFHAGFRALAVTFSLLLAGAVGCQAQAPAVLSPAAAATRDDFRKLVMSDRKAGPLNPTSLSVMDVGMVRVERVRFTPEEGQDATVVIYRPKAETKYPAVILQHFLGGSKDPPVIGMVANSLAQKGFLVAAMDGRYRGERQRGTSLEAAMAESLRSGKGHPFLVDTAYDITRLVDVLAARPDVDPKRIGMTGISEGGILTWMCAALDDRIRVAVPIIGVTCFGDCFNAFGPESAARVKLFEPVLLDYAKAQGVKEIDGMLLRSAWEKLVPGMLDRFDSGKMLPLIAPRPLLILSHENDELFPVEGARKVYGEVKPRYQELKVEDRLDFRVAPKLKHAGANFQDLAAMFQEISGMTDWMEKWLKNAPAS